MEKIADIELTSIDTMDPKPRSFANNANAILIQEDDVETPYGNIHVAIQGDRSKQPILTFHDIGLNHITCFQGFFSYADMQPILRNFCVYHVNAPGQDEGALHLKPEYENLFMWKKISNEKSHFLSPFSLPALFFPPNIIITEEIHDR